MGNGDGTFQNAFGYGAGTGPGSVAVGDFNGDGKPDLAVANIGSLRDNYTDGNVSVLLGNGDGTFRSAVDYGAGSVPRSVTVGDFNGDGKLDLAVANLYSDNLSVLLGKGDGTFQPAVNYVTGTYPFSVYPVSIAAGDFNGDSKPDLAVANITGNVSVLLGRGDGTFETAVNYLAGADLHSVTVADFNGDGKLDLAVAGYAGVSLLPGDGSGTFQTALNYGGEPHFAAVGDFNGDGKADLVVADNDPDNVRVLLGNGDGTFRASAYYWTGKYPGSIAVDDLNADGKADLAVANSGGISVLLGKGDGTFRSAVNYAAGTNPQSVTVGHFNGDGRPDLAVANLESGNVSVLLGNGDGTFPAVANYKVGGLPRAVAVGDFNKDGEADLAVATEAGVPVILGNGDGSFQAAVDYGPIDYESGQGPYSVAVDDFNGDGNADLLVRNVLAADWTDIVTVSLLLGKGDGAFQRPVKLDLGSSPDPGASPGLVAVGDFNGDGKPDLAITSHLFNISTNISVILGKGDGTFQRPVNFDTGGNPFFVAVGDFNGDGKPDLAVLNTSGVTVLLNTCASAGIHLGVARTNTGLTLSWPLPYADFVLESTTSVGSTNWQRAVEAPTTNNARFEITAPFNQQQRFFRLRKP
ncbi:MAG: VCBS repeat-containing protein [Verrucomicrobia bacterium]|nr:MAG: VCBS repeat-containing protein [Verrucomicrobiota bacterium]